jgi:hypothetical protein
MQMASALVVGSTRRIQLMQRNRLALTVLGLLIGLVATLFMACGGGSLPQIPADNTGLPQPEAATPALSGEAPDALPVDEASPNRVSLSVPSLAGLPSGSEFSVELGIAAGESIHQGVLRLSYDEASMEPLAADPGAALPSGMVRIADLDNAGFIPLAFTALPGAADIQPGEGTLYSIRFRLTRPGDSAGRVGFSGDPEFLQLRDRDGNRLEFDTETRAGGSHESR